MERDVGKLEGVPAEGSAEEVVVAVDEAGHHDGAPEVDDGGAGRHLTHGGIAAQANDAAVTDGHGGEAALEAGLTLHSDDAGGVDVGGVGVP